MSEARKIPWGILFYFIFCVFGLAVTTACLAGAAQLMAARGCPGSLAAPLATAAVCAGSLCSGLAAAFRRREQGLLTGLLQSMLPVGLLSAAALLNGSADGMLLPMRLLGIVLCGMLGGVLGVACRANKRITRG